MGIQYNVPLEKFLISHPFYIFDGLYRNPVTKDIYCIIKPNVATPTTKEEKIIVEMKEGEGSDSDVEAWYLLFLFDEQGCFKKFRLAPSIMLDENVRGFGLQDDDTDVLKRCSISSISRALLCDPITRLMIEMILHDPLDPNNRSFIGTYEKIVDEKDTQEDDKIYSILKRLIIPQNIHVIQQDEEILYCSSEHANIGNFVCDQCGKLFRTVRDDFGCYFIFKEGYFSKHKNEVMKLESQPSECGICFDYDRIMKTLVVVNSKEKESKK